MNKGLLKYAIPAGRYRKNLLQAEIRSWADRYDIISKLQVRIKALGMIPEIANPDNTLCVDLKCCLEDLYNEPIRLLADGLTLEDFCTGYDQQNSLLDGMTEAFVSFISDRVSLSEDAAILKRRTYVDKTPQKDPKKVQATKAAWKKFKHKYRAAISKYSKSSASKAFHRNLARFNRSRIKEDLAQFSRDDILTVTKGLSSFLTHLVAEVQAEQISEASAIFPKDGSNLHAYRELYGIFRDLMDIMFESYFTYDKNTISEVLEIITDYYEGEDGNFNS